MNEYHLAYAAGLFDGEGSVFIRKAKPNPRQGRRFVLSLFDVGYKCRNSNKVRPSHHYIVWKWGAWGDKARHVLESLLPYLIVKKEEAIVDILFQEYLRSTIPGGNQRLSSDTLAGREAFRQLLLKKRKESRQAI